MSVAYHRLFRVHPRYRWWRPLVALAIMLGFWLATQIVIAVVLLLIEFSIGGADAARSFTTRLAKDPLDPSHPAVLALTLVSLAVLLPAMMVAVRLAGLGPIGQLSSVAFRIRWRWLARCLLPLAALAVLTVGVQAVGIPGVMSGYFVVRHGAFVPNMAEIGHPTVSATTTIVAIVMVIVLVPLQAAAEEYMFRGFVQQTVGSWVRNPIVAFVASTVCFGAAHVPNGYDPIAILDVASFGFVAALLTWRTGGLEAGILAHALNNVGIFVLQAPGWSKINPNDGHESVLQLGITVVTLFVYAFLVEISARRAGLIRRRPGREAPRLRHRAPSWVAAGADPADWGQIQQNDAGGPLSTGSMVEQSGVGGAL
ncbi:CPBP family intramembrane glutamic endopeptidase [Curtobacterium ammoniigenes]|uniref:CPBP family intramembrane glutamic endopeptidase n=1 Tax=Curtobacterium ammoniigenes TaxID=395387 RepID=UPI00082FA32F|nr:type II CAAX endopeptidase family protein [Curtobacterium ammoniigenes]